VDGRSPPPEERGGKSVRLLRPGDLLSRTLGLLGRTALKISLMRRLMLAIVGFAALLILVVVLVLAPLGS
jgi:hypothetical protein